jgi:hypothetical protein
MVNDQLATKNNESLHGGYEFVVKFCIADFVLLMEHCELTIAH